MRHLLFTCLLLLAGANARAQFPVDSTIARVNETLHGIGLGLPEDQFLQRKKNVGMPDTTMNFRHEIVENIGKDGFSSVTYYFDAELERPMYEFILEFADEKTRRGVEELMLGPANYPDRPDYWILGAQDFVVSIAWTFNNKIVVAANIPGTEWEGDPAFTMPENFQPYALLPNPREWSADERTRFGASLSRQIEAGAGQFARIKGEAREEDPAYFYCTEPLSAAEDAAVFQDEKGKWIVGNTLASGMPLEDSEIWKNGMRELLNAAELSGFQLRPGKTREDFGGLLETWTILDAAGKNTGLLVGLVNYEWDAEGLYSIDVLVMQE